MHMSRFLSSSPRISGEGYGGAAAFDGVSMGGTHESHIFAISRQTHLFILLIRPAVVFFEKNDFFREVWNSIISPRSISQISLKIRNVYILQH